MPVVTELQEKLLLQIGDDFAKFHVRIFEPEQSKGVVFYVHDFTGNGADFTFAANALSASGYTVVCPDLPGRGQSAYLAPRKYNLQIYMNVLAAVYKKFSGSTNILIGQAWGSMLATIFAASTSVRFQKIITLDLPTKWSLSGDKEIAQAAHDAGMSFQTQFDALEYLLAKPEFCDLKSDAETHFLDDRITEIAESFRFAFDPGLFKFFGVEKNRVYEIAKVLDGVSSNVFCLYANEISKDTERDIGRVNPRGNAPVLVANATTGKKLHMNTLNQILLVLGCIATLDQ